MRRGWILSVALVGCSSEFTTGSFTDARGNDSASSGDGGEANGENGGAAGDQNDNGGSSAEGGTMNGGSAGTTSSAGTDNGDAGTPGGGNGAGGANGGSAGMGSNAGASGGGEHCTNGVDDDANNLADCADPACSDYACAAAAPVGWLGPVSLWTGPPSERPACSGVFDTEVFLLGVTANSDPAICPACSCSAEGLHCDTDAELFSYTGEQCTVLEDSFEPWSVGDGCYRTEWSADSISAGATFVVSGSTTAGNACAPVLAGEVAAPGEKWTTVALGCGATPRATESCNGDALCLPSAAAVCVHREGDHSCPQGYPVKELFFTDAQDTRGCTACECDEPACTGTFTLHQDTACEEAPTVTLSGKGTACASFSDENGNGEISAQFLGGEVSCAARAPTPSGAVVPEEERTVCCQE